MDKITEQMEIYGAKEGNEIASDYSLQGVLLLMVTIKYNLIKLNK